MYRDAFNLTLYRKRAGLTQGQLAEKLGIKRQVLALWEKGECYPRIETAVDIGRVLDTDPSLIFPEMFKVIPK